MKKFLPYLLPILLILTSVFGDNLAREIKISLTGLLTSGLLIFVLQTHSLKISKTFLFLYCLFLITQIVSLISSVSPYRSLLRVGETVSYLPMILAFSSLTNQIKTKASDKKSLLVNFLIIMATVFAMVGIAEYAIQYPGLPIGHVLREPLHYQGSMAALFILILPVSLYLFFAQKGLKKILLLYINFLLIVALFLTKELFSILVFFALTVLPLVYISIKNRTFSFSLKEFVSLILLLILLFPFLSGQSSSSKIFIPTADFQLENTRTELFHSFWQTKQVLAQKPLLGFGPGTYFLISQNFQQAPWLRASNANNEYLQNFAEGGLLGGLVFLVLSTYLIFLCLRALKNDRSLVSLRIPLALSILSFLFLNINSFSFRHPLLSFIFYLILAFFLSEEISCQNLSPKFLKHYTFNPRLMTIVVSLSFIFVLLNGELFVYGLLNNQFKSKTLIKNISLEQLSQQLKLLFKLNPYDPEPPLIMANKLVQDGKYNLAIPYLNLSITKDRQNLENNLILADLLWKNNQATQARQLLEKTIKINPFLSPQTPLLLEKILSQDGFKNEGRLVLQSAVNFYPLNSDYFRYKIFFDYNGDSQALFDSLLTLNYLKPNSQYLDVARLIDRIPSENP